MAQVVPELIERNFGDYELQADFKYNLVWEVDASDVTAAPKAGGESVEQVPKAELRYEFFLHQHLMSALLLTVWKSYSPILCNGNKQV